MITRRHLNVQDQGVPGQRLGKAAKNSTGETGSASQWAGQIRAEGKGGARAALSTPQPLTPAIGNNVVGKTREHLDAQPLTSTTGNSGVGKTREQAVLSTPPPLTSTTGNSGVGSTR